MSQTESEFYATVDNVKKKLRLPEVDKSIDEELQLYAQEVDGYIITELTNKLGSFDENGDPIDVDLTISTSPDIDSHIRTLADDLLEGKFRLKTTNDEILWNSARKEFLEYLDRRFGWTEGTALRKQATFTMTPLTGPVSTVITLTGVDWALNEEVEFFIAGVQVTPTPDPTFTTATGGFSATITIPATQDTGSTRIKVVGQGPILGRTQKLANSFEARFNVTP